MMRVSIFLTLFFVLFASGLVESSVFPRVEVAVSKRGGIQFFNIIRRYVGRSPWDYWGYGCWCGFGGKGRPLDRTDRCCRSHDWCFNWIVRNGYCTSDQTYIKNYYYILKWGYLSCRKEWWLTSRCGRALCHCDIVAAKCFKRHLNSFNKRYRKWKKNTC